MNKAFLAWNTQRTFITIPQKNLSKLPLKLNAFALCRSQPIKNRAPNPQLKLIFLDGAADQHSTQSKPKCPSESFTHECKHRPCMISLAFPETTESVGHISSTMDPLHYLCKRNSNKKKFPLEMVQRRRSDATGWGGNDFQWIRFPAPPLNSGSMGTISQA